MSIHTRRRSSVSPTYDWHLPSPNTPRDHAAQVQDVQQTLYGQSPAASDLTEIVDRLYERDAVYQSPLVVVTKRQRIAEQFALLRMLPGELWSEMEDVFEAEDFRGLRSFTFNHTLHYSLFPSLSSNEAPNTGHSGYSSLASTPFRHSPGASPILHTNMKLYRASHTSDKSPSPITRAAKWLNPFYVVGKVTTVALRIQTRIEFNERGKISKHHDTVGIGEILEAFAIVRPIYHIQRRTLGKLSSLASQVLFSQEETAANQNRAISTDENVFGGALGLELSPKYMGDSVKEALEGLKGYQPATVNN